MSNQHPNLGQGRPMGGHPPGGARPPQQGYPHQTSYQSPPPRQWVQPTRPPLPPPRKGAAWPFVAAGAVTLATLIIVVVYALWTPASAPKPSTSAAASETVDETHEARPASSSAETSPPPSSPAPSPTTPGLGPSDADDIVQIFVADLPATVGKYKAKQLGSGVSYSHGANLVLATAWNVKVDQIDDYKRSLVRAREFGSGKGVCGTFSETKTCYYISPKGYLLRTTSVSGNVTVDDMVAIGEAIAKYQGG